MKPDGVATTPSEPADDVVEPVSEAAASEEQVQQDSSQSSPRAEKPENEGEHEGANATLPPPGKEVHEKFSDHKDNSKAPVKPKPGTASTKATTTTGVASRSATAQSRVANGVVKTASNGARKKPESMTSEIKRRTAAVGTSTLMKKVPTATTVPPRMQVKAAEQKGTGSPRPVPSTSSGTRKTGAAATSSALSKKPVAGGSNAAYKPKTTAPRPATAPNAKVSLTHATKAAPIPKTTRSTVATTTHPTTSTSVRPTTTASKSIALRMVSAPSSVSASHPTKGTTTVAAKKDIKATTSAMARKPLVSTTTCSTATKASKPGTAVKRLPTDTRTCQTKTNETRQVPARKVPPSPRNISSRPAPGRMAAELSNHKQGASSNLAPVKRQTTRPTQSVLPLVIKEKPSEERPAEHVEPSVILETSASVVTAGIAPVESVIEAQTQVELAHPDQQTSALEGTGEGVQEPVLEPTNTDGVSAVTIDAEPLAVQSVANVPVPVMSNHPAVVPESELHDSILGVAPTQEISAQEPVTASPCEVPCIVQVPPKDLEAVEKQEQTIPNLEEEEEREGSQQVSLSEMSGTQPTEESRPGSAGLAGSVWRAGGLPSEFDSEDVSCSQQGASELSAPGVLEGTESMDDLGEASLKGVDEGASAGSPDFEKFPDIPVNEDDDDEDDDDHVDDMEVGSEMTEDQHGQCNDNEDEDEDVEMASEGVTESGLESYGNADEDDFAEDYRLDNLNRMQPSSIVPTAFSAANPFGDAWMQTTLLSSPSSNPWQTCSGLPNQPAAQVCLDIERDKTNLSPAQSPAVMDPVPSSPLPSSEPPADMGLGLKQGFSQSSALHGPDLAIHTCSDVSTPEEVKDYDTGPELENQKQPSPVRQTPVALPDIMQDQSVCRSDCAGSEHKLEEPEILPVDDVLAALSTVTASAPFSHSSATCDEASDTEGDVQIKDPTEPGSTINECFDGSQVVHSMSALVEECEEACVELEGGGGSDTPQSATSAASYGYECTTSNSNAQSTTESCIKSPGIFSLENEEQLPDETKDPSLIKELNLAPADAPADADLLDQQGELQLNSEQQYMFCGKVTEELPEPCSREPVPIETGLDVPSSSEHQKDLDHDTPHPYYSTICEKTDSLTGSDLCVQQLEKVSTVHMTRPSKHHSGLRVDHVTHLPSVLPFKNPNVVCSAQLRRLEQHQQQLEEIEQRRTQQSRRAERRMEEREEEKKENSQVEGELEQNREEKEQALEEQRRDLHLQIQQQQQELKQRQQLMQWQQELEQQKQGKHQNSHQKNLTPGLLSPSGLCTIYEALENSDAEEDLGDQMEEKEMVLKIKIEHECSPTERISILEAGSSSDSSQSQNTSLSPNLIHDHEGLPHPISLDGPHFSESSSPQQLSPLELDWSKKADIVQRLINQSLLLNGDNCSPLLLLPGGAAGTLSPLETSLWPNLPPLTPPSATVTSVSSFSAEVSGSSPQGEWTVVELETHH